MLDIVSLLEPLEAQTRDVQDDTELLAFRAALAAVYAAYATSLIELEENVCHRFGGKLTIRQRHQGIYAWKQRAY